jgi:hypothetical protein
MVTVSQKQIYFIVDLRNKDGSWQEVADAVYARYGHVCTAIPCQSAYSCHLQIPSVPQEPVEGGRSNVAVALASEGHLSDASSNKTDLSTHLHHTFGHLSEKIGAKRPIGSVDGGTNIPSNATSKEGHGYGNAEPSIEDVDTLNPAGPLPLSNLRATKRTKWDATPLPQESEAEFVE